MVQSSTTHRSHIHTKFCTFIDKATDPSVDGLMAAFATFCVDWAPAPRVSSMRADVHLQNGLAQRSRSPPQHSTTKTVITSRDNDSFLYVSAYRPILRLFAFIVVVEQVCICGYVKVNRQGGRISEQYRLLIPDSRSLF